MQKLVLAVPLAVALLTATATSSLAVVDCSTVNKDIKLGEWPVDVAASMGITLTDVKNCQTRAGATTKDSATPGKSGTAPHSNTPAAAHPRGK